MNLTIIKIKKRKYALAFTLMIVFLFTVPGITIAQEADISTLPVVVVSASRTVTVSPDQAEISMAVMKTDPNLDLALKSNNQSTEQVIQALERAGIKPEDIKTSNFSVYPEYDYSESGRSRITAYQVRNEISVLVRDLNLLGDILDTAIRSGANNLNYISFQKADTSAAEDQALVQAVKRAREKALILSKAAGMNLGRLLSISEGYSQPVLYSNKVYADTSAGGMGASSVPINPGELQISATVTCIFEMN